MAVTIGHTNVTGTLTNFPVLVNITNSALATIRPNNGNDILFTSGDGTNKLPHEIESYTSSNGLLVAWVNVPSLSSAADTNIYLYYGNASATNQQNISGTWDSNFKGVWHLNNSLTDSTANGNNGSNTLTIDAAGKISDGRGFVRSNGIAFITISGLVGSSSNLTLSGWINLNSLDTGGAEFISLGDHAGVRQDNTGIVGDIYNGTAWLTTPSTTNFVGKGWRHVAYTVDSAGHSQILYVDGVQIAASAYTNAPSYSGLGSNTIIGKHGNGATGYSFDGTMDEMRVSSTPRSAGWIATERNNQNSPSAFYSLAAPESSSAKTNFLHFSATTLAANSGPINPANGVTSFGGAALNAGDLVVFDGLVIDTSPGSSDAWGAVELNQKGGTDGLTLAQLGVLTRYTTNAASYCQLWTNGVAASNFPVASGAHATNRVRIELTATLAGSTTNMNWSVKIDQGLTGGFTTAQSGTNVTFANNAIGLTFGAYTDPSLFVDLSSNPVITSQPASQTVTAGNSVTFTAAAGGLAPLSYQWCFNGGGISGATAASYSLTNAFATNAGNFTVVITNMFGSVTSSVAVLTVNKAAGTVSLGSLSQTYGGSAEPATAVTTPGGLTVSFTYNGSANAPTNAGSYTVIGTINDANYQGSSTNTLTISKAAVTIASGLTANNKVYNGANTATISSNNVVLSGVFAGDAANAKLSTNGYTAAFAGSYRGNQPGRDGQRPDIDRQRGGQLHPHPAQPHCQYHRGHSHDFFRPVRQQQGL